MSGLVLPKWHEIDSATDKAFQIDRSGYTLHCKIVTTIDIPKLLELPTYDNSTLGDVTKAVAWLSDARLYKPAESARLDAARIPRSDVLLMAERGKVRRTNVHKATCRVFKVPEDNKKRYRAIEHPRDINEHCASESPVKFLTAHQRHQAVHAGEWVVDLDFAAYYDQFGLSEAVSEYFAFLAGGQLWRMIVLPMGFKNSVNVSQHATRHMLNFKEACEIHSEPYIDNARFVSGYEKAITAASIFAVRAAEANATLNEIDLNIIRAIPDMEGKVLKARELVTPLAKQKGEWLGEVYDYKNKTVEMSQRTRAKLEAIIDNWASHPPTFKSYAAAFAILQYVSRTYNLRLGPYFGAIRALRVMSKLLTEVPELWPEKAPEFAPHITACLRKWKHDLLRQKPRVVNLASAPDAFMVVDASAWGWAAAYVDSLGCEHYASNKWNPDDNFRFHSTHAEPEGIYRAICRFIKPGTQLKLKVATDSSSAQQTLPKGHAKSWFINEVCNRLYGTFPGLELDAQHIEGASMPVDQMSRGFARELSVSEWEKVRGLYENQMVTA